MNPQVDAYLADGCGRCDLYATADCKVNNWRKELTFLRQILLECGLTEDLKWKQPCYTFKNKNVVLLTAFKNYAALGFFKGALLSDTGKVLIRPGENSRAVRQLRFTDAQDIMARETLIKKYVFEAVEVEKAGRQIKMGKASELDVPEELQQKFEKMPALKTAFTSLTPGRQRGYLLYFAQAKKSKTRESRIEKYIPRILAGKGFHDR